MRESCRRSTPDIELFRNADAARDRQRACGGGGGGGGGGGDKNGADYGIH